MHIRDLVFLLKHVFLPCDIFIFRECLCECPYQSPLIDHHLCDLLLELTILQLDCLYDSLLVRELPPDMLFLCLQLTVYLLYILLKLLKPLILPLEVALQLAQLLPPRSLYLFNLRVTVPAHIHQLLLQIRNLSLLE